MLDASQERTTPLILTPPSSGVETVRMVNVRMDVLGPQLEYMVSRTRRAVAVHGTNCLDTCVASDQSETIVVFKF